MVLVPMCVALASACFWCSSCCCCSLLGPSAAPSPFTAACKTPTLPISVPHSTDKCANRCMSTNLDTWPICYMHDTLIPYAYMYRDCTVDRLYCGVFCCCCLLPGPSPSVSQQCTIRQTDPLIVSQQCATCGVKLLTSTCNSARLW